MNIDKAENIIEYSDKDKEFLQLWLAKWHRPREWTQAAIFEEMSPLPRFLEWLNQDSTSLPLVLQCLQEFPANESPPRLAQVTAVYKRKCGRYQQTTKPTVGVACTICNDTGIVFVACARKEAGSTVSVIIDPARPDPHKHVFVNSAPCICPAGDHTNAAPAYRYSKRLRDRAAGCAVTPSQYWGLRAQCLAMAGVEVPERKEAPGAVASEVPVMQSKDAALGVLDGIRQRRIGVSTQEVSEDDF